MHSDLRALVRKRFEAGVKGRTLAGLQSSVHEMEQMLSALNSFIAQQEIRTGVTDVNHCTYSAPAKAARDRALRLERSIVDLTAKIESATIDRDRILEALSELEAAAHRFSPKRESL